MPVKIYVIGEPDKMDGEEMGDDDAKIQDVKQHLSAGHHTYMFIFMTGCGPCNSTKPEWNKFANQYKSEHANTSKNIMIVCINKDLFGQLIDEETKKSLAGEEPGGFPTLRHISNGVSNEYETQMKDDASRTKEAFNAWVNKTSTGQFGGRTSKRTKSKSKQTKKSKKTKSKTKKTKKSIKQKRRKSIK